MLIKIPKLTVRDASEERIHIQECSAVMRHWVVGIKALVGTKMCGVVGTEDLKGLPGYYHVPTTC